MVRKWHLELLAGLVMLPLCVFAREDSRESVQVTGMLRVQWSDAQGVQGSDGFSIRWALLGVRVQADSQTTVVTIVDLASGDGGRAAELIDAYVIWRPNARATVFAGQILTPLFYDVRRSIVVLETLERGNTTRTFLGGAYARGGYVAYRLDAHNTLEAGIWNSLTYRDLQLDARGGQAAVAGMLNWRYSRGDTQFTLGGWVGRRPRLH